ncbi:MAG: hypothetical protein HY222_03465 [Thaumarchaeota archaeon]|nr:hypothetical protein [Nitrososphaerota archaeon]MBI3641434.1 hypothetical protein [Nitrososphaerota archaeon]
MDKLSQIENKLQNLEERVLKLEKKSHDGNDGNTKGRLDNFEKKLEGKIDIIGPQNLIIFGLKLKPKQSKNELETLLISWGAKQTIRGWLKGGNFSKRLLKTGIVMKDGKNTDGDVLYSLTRVKGVQIVDDLIEKHNL